MKWEVEGRVEDARRGQICRRNQVIEEAAADRLKKYIFGTRIAGGGPVIRKVVYLSGNEDPTAKAFGKNI